SIGGNRRAMHDRRDGAHTADRVQPVEKTLRFVAAMRGHFGDAEAARGRIEQEQIGERAADVDADDRARHGHALVPARAAAAVCASSEPSAPTTTPYARRATSRER